MLTTPNLMAVEALLLKNKFTREHYTKEYNSKAPLYYKERPEFEEILKGIEEWLRSQEK